MGALRFFLAYVVLISHCPDGLLIKVFHPGLAVQCFFIISGFYMQLLMSKKYKGQKPAEFYKSFYSSRAFRIFPIYLLMLSVTFLFVRKGSLPTILSSGNIEALFIYISTNLLILGQSFLRFFSYDLSLGEFFFYDSKNLIDSRASFTLLIQSWSLDLELLFYILAPFILTIKRFYIVFAIACSSILLRFILALNGYTYTLRYGWVNEFFPSELAIFLLGALSYRIYYFCKNESINYAPKLEKLRYLFISNRYFPEAKGVFDRVNAKISVKKLFLFSLYVYASYYVINFYAINPFRFNLGGAWNQGLFGVPNSYWYILLMNAFFIPILFDLSKNFKFDTFIGNLSYPLYICHYPMICFVERAGVKDQMISIYTLVSTTILSILLVLFVDNPITKYRHKKFYKIKKFQK